MSGQARRREYDNALQAILSEQAGAERYRHRQLQARRGSRRSADRDRPMEFDESGFPIPQRRNSSFVQRVAELLKPL